MLYKGVEEYLKFQAIDFCLKEREKLSIPGLLYQFKSSGDLLCGIVTPRK